MGLNGECEGYNRIRTYMYAGPVCAVSWVLSNTRIITTRKGFPSNWAGPSATGRAALRGTCAV
jgi:hypothetical protein